MREFVKKKHGELTYLITYPQGYQEGEKYPILFMFHGAGTRNRVDYLETHVFFKELAVAEEQEAFPFITIMPLCIMDSWFDVFEQLRNFVKGVAASSYADPSRIYFIGASMGGYCTWQLGMSMADYVAAIVPICGGGMYWNGRRLKDVGVWAFHGEKDQTVLVEESVKMVEGVNRNGGNARLTIYPDCEHDSWSPTFRNPEVFRWLLSHTRSNSPACGNDTHSGAEFG